MEPHQDADVGAVAGDDVQEVGEGVEGDAVGGGVGPAGHQHRPLLGAWGPPPGTPKIEGGSSRGPVGFGG